MFNVLMKDKKEIPYRGGSWILGGEGGSKIIFTMGEGMGGHATPIGGQVRFFTFPFIYM